MSTSALPTAERPFRIADAMVLIAATFIALAWDRSRVLAPFRPPSEAIVGLPGWLYPLVALGALGLPFLVMASVADCLLRLQSPRPAWGELLRQPGMVACAPACLAMVAVTVGALAAHLGAGRPWAAAWAQACRDLAPERLTMLASLIGLAILMAWIVLGVTRRWRPEPSWIDRLGRFVGAGWIAFLTGGVLVLFLQVAGLAAALG